MKKLFTYLLLAPLALAPISAQAQDAQHLLQFQTQYGDAMGNFADSQASKITEYLYGKDNRIERKILTGKLYNSNGWNLVTYSRYEYDANGLKRTNSLDYGLNSSNEFTFKATKDTVDYKYNEKGQLVSDSTYNVKGSTYYYYDEAGNLVKKVVNKNQVWYQTFEYSDFVKGGAQTVKVTARSSYNAYNGEMSYDENGNMLADLHYTTAGVLKSAEYWTYDESGTLVLYEKKGISSGKEVDSQKTEYTKLENGDIQRMSYTYGNSGWGFKGGSKYIDHYDNFNAQFYAPEIQSIDVDNTTSTATIKFKVAETMKGVDTWVDYVIYRNGIAVDTLRATDADVETYTETGVPNGTWEYMVQTMCAGEKKNVSNVMSATFERTYPHAKNFRAVSAKLNENNSYIVTFAWTNPAFTKDMGFKYNNVMKIGKYYTTPMLDSGYEITDPETQTVDINFGIDAVQKVYLATTYDGGTVSSDTISVDATKLIGKVSEETKQLRVVETYGDAMGEDMGITKKTVTYYGNDNRVQRIAKYAKAVNTDGNDPKNWTISEYTRNIYGESGQMEKSYTQQYGRYNYGTMGFKAASDTTYYEYNVDGEITKETNNEGYSTYEYDANGSLTKKYTIQYGNKNLETTVEYSNFAGTNLPQTTVSSGTGSSDNYMLETTYNEAGKKLTEKKSTWSNMYGEYRGSQFEQLYYNESGELSCDSVWTIKISNDIENYTIKSYTTYEPEENNPNRVKVVKKVWDTILKKFSNPKTWNVYEYTEINASKYSTAITVTPVEGKLNTVDINVDIPADLQNGMTALNIYRNGIEIAHALGCEDENYSKFSEYGSYLGFIYTDNKVQNGLADYFVEYAKFDATMTDEAQVNNISNVVFYDFNTPLPAITNLHVVKGSSHYTTVQNTDAGQTEINAYTTVAWNAPENAEAYGLKRYNVMVIPNQVGENYNDSTEASRQTSYELEFRGLDSLQVYIQAEYEIGRVNSDTITLYQKDVLNPTVEGDVNGDKTVDIADVNAIIAVICGTAPNSSQGGENGSADVNGDGTVDIADVNAVIAIICGKDDGLRIKD